MEAIRSRLPANAAITVDFNAWCYERERELLIPLLDSVRDGCRGDREGPGRRVLPGERCYLL
jgi:hypothetical protein